MDDVNWEVKESDPGYRNELGCPGYEVRVGYRKPDGWFNTIAEFWTNATVYDNPKEALASHKSKVARAHLIASAPELLVACENAAKALDRWQDNTPSEQAAIDQLRTVIGKAKG